MTAFTEPLIVRALDSDTTALAVKSDEAHFTVPIAVSATAQLQTILVGDKNVKLTDTTVLTSTQTTAFDDIFGGATGATMGVILVRINSTTRAIPLFNVSGFTP